MSVTRALLSAFVLLGLSLLSTPVLFAEPGSVGGVSVTPDGSNTPDRDANTTGYSAAFTVKNTGTSTDEFSIGCYGTTGVTCTGPSTWVVTLLPNRETTVYAYYNVGSPGNGKIYLTAFSEETFAQDNGYWNVPIVSTGPPDNWDITPYNYDNQDMSRCAAGCFAATAAHGTVPYFSLDTPRNITLVYNGSRVNPKPFVHLNVEKPNAQTPNKVWLQVKRNGTLQVFANGESTLKFSAASSGEQRIGGQLRDSTLATGMYDIQIIVTWEYTGSTIVQSWDTKLLVVNESASPIARGWTIAGLQRMHVQSDSSVLITEGDGSAVYYEKSGGSWVTPNGDFSTLSRYGTGWRRLYPDSTDVRFNSYGRMTDIYDQFNNRTQFGYSSDRVTTITDPYGKVLYLSYSTSPYRLYSVRSSFYPWRYTYYTVQTDGRLTAIRDPDNIYTYFGYDSSKRLSTITDRRSKTTTFAYDSQSGTLASVTSPAVPIYGSGSVQLTTSYDSWQKKGVPYGSTSSTPHAIVPLDSVYGTVTTPDATITRFTVDRWGQPVVSQSPYGDDLEVKTTLTYNDDGMPTLAFNSADPTDTTRIQYNADGLVTSVRRTGTTADTIIYGAWAQPVHAYGSGKPETKAWLGTNGRVDSTLAGGVRTRYTYDYRGRIVTVKDGLNNLVQTNAYSSPNGNLSSVTRPGSRVTTYGYDTYGRQTTVAHTGLPTRTTYYDVLNRPDSIRDGVNSRATRFGYDALYQTSVTDPAGHVYTYVFNDVGWLVEEKDPANRSEYLHYSRAGNLMRWTNRRSQHTDYAYDALYRPTAKWGSNTDSTSFSYSSNGREITGTSTVSSETQYFSLLGQPDSVVTAMGGRTYRQKYDYSAAGVIDSMWATGSGATFLRRQYSWTTLNGRLTQIKVGNKSTTLSYNANGVPTSITYPGNHVIGRQPTTGSQTAAIESNKPTLDDLLDRRLEYDNVGRIKSHYSSANPVELGNVFAYDGLNRLVRDTAGILEPDECTWDADFGWECPPPETATVRSFVYDSIGNVKRDSVHHVNYGTHEVTTGTYNSTTGRITSFGGCDYETDYDGNVIERSGCGASTITYYWSSENRLDSIAVGAQKIRHYYDAFGRLVKRSGTSTRYYLWAGDNLFAELESNGSKSAEYSYWPGGLDNLHALVIGDTVYAAHSDGLGNVIGLVNDSPSLKRRYEYDVWGELVGGSDGASFNGCDRARFKGALSMGDLGAPDLYYMRNRWYEPSTSRFLSEDPIGLAGGINLYVFAGNNPVSGRDPTGLDECDGNSLGHYHYSEAFYGVSSGDALIVTVQRTWHDCSGSIGSGGGSMDGPAGWGGTGASIPLNGSGSQLFTLGQGETAASQGAQTGSCIFNPNFLRQLDKEFEVALFEQRERGGWYGAPWSSPVRMTGINRGPSGITIPLHPGASGYWHVHWIPSWMGYSQRPGPDDLRWVRTWAHSMLFTVSRDSLYVTDPSGNTIACRR